MRTAEEISAEMFRMMRDEVNRLGPGDVWGQAQSAFDIIARAIATECASAKLEAIEPTSGPSPLSPRPLISPRPRVYRDGTQWCAVYGTDIAVGVAAFADTEAAARAAFVDAWAAASERERWRAHNSFDRPRPQRSADTSRDRYITNDACGHCGALVRDIDRPEYCADGRIHIWMAE